MLEDFKTNILSSLSSQLDTLQMKKKREETKQALDIFCLRCRTKHPRREFLWIRSRFAEYAARIMLLIIVHPYQD
jgi:hypothetical protein